VARLAELMHTVHNARIQLLATLLNTMAATSFTVGIAAPIAAGIFYGQGIPLHAVEIGAILWAVPVVFLHGVAQIVLRGLR
jgi:hypothetical protein